MITDPAVLLQRLHEPDLVADAVLADVVARLPGDKADDDEGVALGETEFGEDSGVGVKRLGWR